MRRLAIVGLAIGFVLMFTERGRRAREVYAKEVASGARPIEAVGTAVAISSSPANTCARRPAALSRNSVSSGGGDQVALIDTIEDTEAPDPQGSLSQTEMKEAIGEAIARLPEREKLVVTLYYYEELTLREIGEVLGVTESRV